MTDLFITVQDLSNRLGRDLSNDPGGTFAVTAACDVCRVVAEQPLMFGTTTIRLDGTGTDCLILPFHPVSAVGTVTVNGDAVTEFTFSEMGLLFRGTAGVFPGPAWTSGRQNVSVTFEHGYGTANFPAAVKEVALSVASRAVVQGVAKSETIGDVSVDYGMQASDLTENELRILRRYRRTRGF